MQLAGSSQIPSHKSRYAILSCFDQNQYYEVSNKHADISPSVLSSLPHLLEPLQTSLEKEIMTQLCEACRGINLDALRDLNGYEHVPNARDILASAKTCLLCNLILLALLQNTTALEAGVEDKKFSEIILPKPLLLRGNPPQERGDAVPLTGVDVHVAVDWGEDIVKLNLFALAGRFAPPCADLSD
jgi:hypothetical protein